MTSNVFILNNILRLSMMVIKSTINVFCLLLLLCSFYALAATPLTYKITGVDNDLRKNIELHLQALPGIDVDKFYFFQNDISQTVRQALQPMGYYSPTLKLTLSDSKQGLVTITIKIGQPVLLRTVSIQLEGEAKQDPPFIALLKEHPIHSGSSLNHQQYESLKKALNSLALLRGYFDAHFTRHSIKVYPEPLAADLNLLFSSGPRYQFGTVRYGDMSSGTKNVIQTMIGFKPETPYETNKIIKLYNDLSSTHYFHKVDVHPVHDDNNTISIPVDVNVITNLNHEIETGVGFSTDEGPRMSITWDKPWVNDRGHSVSNIAQASGKRVELSSSYQIPMGNPLQEFYSLQGGYQYKDSEDTLSNRFSAAVHRWHKDPEGWDRDLYISLESEQYEQGLTNDRSLLLIPGIALNRRQVQGNLNPTQGTSHNLKLEVSHKAWGTSASFIRLWGRSKWLDTFQGKHRILARIEQGITITDAIDDLPPSLRFFAGGDQSIRGFNYESIAPKDSFGKLIGGKYLTVTSFEYNYKVTNNWWVATFIDTGTSTNNYNNPWKTGSGIGLRWITPLGPLRIDFAFAISEEDSPWLLHFSIGPDL